MQIFKLFEEFFKEYRYTVQALVALGTIGSAIVAVVLAISQNKVKTTGIMSIKVWIDSFGFVEPGIRIGKKVVTEADGNLFIIANIQNIGNVRLAIDSELFYIKFPFVSDEYVFRLPDPIDNIYSRHKFPVWIEPGESKRFVAPYQPPSIPPIKNFFYRFLLQIFATRLLRWTRLFQIKAFTFTSTSRVINLKISKHMNKQLLDIILQKKQLVS